MEKVTENVYAETGFAGCNTSFVVTKEGVVVIDTPEMPADAIRWRNEAAKHGPIRYVINTSPHFDHFDGNFAFEGAVIISSEETRRVMLKPKALDETKDVLMNGWPWPPGTEATRPPGSTVREDPENLKAMDQFAMCPPFITATNAEQLTLYLGDHTFQLINLPGHTRYEMPVYVPEERVALTGDDIFGKTQAYIIPTQSVPREWLDSLKRLQELDIDKLVPGHGSIGDPSYIQWMSAFIQAYLDEVGAAIKQGWSLEEAQDKIRLFNDIPVEAKDPCIVRQIQHMNVTCVYDTLKGGGTLPETIMKAL